MILSPLILRSDRARRGRVSKGWIIDLGPEGGDKGGEVVAEGTPEQVAKEPRSYTGQYLTDVLAKSKRTDSESAIKFTKARSRTSKREREAAE